MLHPLCVEAIAKTRAAGRDPQVGDIGGPPTPLARKHLKFLKHNFLFPTKFSTGVTGFRHATASDFLPASALEARSGNVAPVPSDLLTTTPEIRSATPFEIAGTGIAGSRYLGEAFQPKREYRK